MSKDQKETAANKELRKDVNSRLSFALDHLKTLLGEKKFNNRIKKAARLLTEGMTGSPVATEEQKTATAPVKKAPVKKAKAPAKKQTVAKATAPKAAVKNAAPKKAATKPVAKKATAKK